MFDSLVGYWGVAISVDRCLTILGKGQAWKLCQYIFIFFSSFPFSDKVQVLFVKFFFNSQRLLCSLHLTQLKILYQVNGELSVNIHKWRIYLQKMNVSSVQRIETLMTKDPAKNSFFWGELNLSKPYIKLLRSTTSWEPCFPLHHLPLYLFTKAFHF